MSTIALDPRTASGRPGRRTLSDPLAYALSAAIIGFALFASATPSPLYETYSRLWGFSSVVLTLVYATYAGGVLVALLLAGRASDVAGRRPVLLIALGALIGSSALYMVATSVAWLFAARAIQGLATGLALATASAGLLDFHPRRDSESVGLTNGSVSAGGLGLGALVSATAVQLLPAPRVVPYAIGLGLFALAFAGALVMPEPVPQRAPLRLTPQRPRVPAHVRGPFVLAALAVASAYSIGGLFFALGPQLGGQVFDTSNHLVTGISLFLLAGVGSAAQLAYGRRSAWAGMAGGSVALALGVGLIALAASDDAAALLLAGSVVGGAGFGIAFLGALRNLSAVIPPEDRAAVMSAFFLVAYSALSVPAVLAGLVETQLSLSSTFAIFGAAVAALALFVALQAWRARPRAVAVAVEARP
ncbi:MAG TPA: MFS transporter [Solirubrobacteraceae bacterium]|nr:MFS transporter [Solirubrobacteraceae bacterium]